MASARTDREIAWYENDGQQTFTEHVIAANVIFPGSVLIVDLDADGNSDVLSLSSTGILWLQNDGSENFIRNDIPTTFVGARGALFAADMDGDGDTDLLTGIGFNDDETAWYENDGAENFTRHIISTEVSASLQFLQQI